ncbi:MAG: serine protease [Oligoflexales bacterium]
MVKSMIWITFIFSVVLVACKHKNIKPIRKENCEMNGKTLSCENMTESSSFQLIEGNIVDYQEFPSVHILYNLQSKSFCTGTFVRPNLMITAGHCIQNPTLPKTSFAILEPNFDAQTITSFSIKARSIDYQMNHEYVRKARSHGESSIHAFLLDVGFVVFPDNTSDSYREINFKPISYGQIIELVGFGKYNRRKIIDLRKRTGTNAIAQEIYHKDVIEIEQVIDYWKVDEEKGDTGVLSGDSGGPMLHEDKIVGIVSGYSYKKRSCVTGVLTI